MRTTERLLDELNRAFGGEAWFGPPLRNALDGVTEEQANQRPIAGAHSILELVVHVRRWIDVVAHRVATSDLVFTTKEDWSDVSKTSWRAALEELEHAESRLVDAVARLSEEQVQKVYNEVLGVIEHNVYHAGQIVLLKRALKIG